MKKKKPYTGGRPVQGKTGDIDGLYLTRPAPDIQAQFPAFASLTPSLQGECREVAR